MADKRLTPEQHAEALRRAMLVIKNEAHPTFRWDRATFALPLAEALLALTRISEEQRRVCGEAYQLAGAIGAPSKALDNLSYASQGTPLPHATFLPVVDTDCSVVAGQAKRIARIYEMATRAIAQTPGAQGLGPYDGSPEKAWHGLFVWLTEKIQAQTKRIEELKALAETCWQLQMSTAGAEQICGTLSEEITGTVEAAKQYGKFEIGRLRKALEEIKSKTSQSEVIADRCAMLEATCDRLRKALELLASRQCGSFCTEKGDDGQPRYKEIEKRCAACIARAALGTAPISHAPVVKDSLTTESVIIDDPELIPDDLCTVTVMMPADVWIKLERNVTVFGQFPLPESCKVGPRVPSLSLIAERLREKCEPCHGKGKLRSGSCNCGSGEGCTWHSETALSMFGTDCPGCGGTGKQSVHGARFAPVGQHVECK